MASRLAKQKPYFQSLSAKIDPSCISSELLGSDIEQALNTLEMKYVLEQQTIPAIITFRRAVAPTLKASSSRELRITDKNHLEPHVIYFISGASLVNFINSKSLVAHIETIKESYPGWRLYLLICGLRGHCKTNRGCVNRSQTESTLTELQLTLQVSHRLLESKEEVAATIGQFFKSIAEEPLKKQKTEKFERETFYLGNDSRDCVKILNEKIGLSRLWQQQLIKLPMVTLEIAEAITAAYPMPSQLFSALKTATDPDRLLEDLPIRRSGHASAACRRIGPELSRKVSQLFLSLDPNCVIWVFFLYLLLKF